jgi:Tol biopolymer transport system component
MLEIAFSAVRDGDADIYSIRADGSGFNRITDNDKNDYLPLWSPSGDRLIYVTESPPTGQYRLTMVSEDGVSRVLLNPGFLSFGDEKAWAPDSIHLAYSGPPSGETFSDIYIMNVRDRSVRNLTYDRTRTGSSITWSSDGERLAYETGISDLDKDRRIFIAEVDNTQLSMLDTGFADETHPSWNPIVDTILFSGATEDENILAVIDLETRELTVIAQQELYNLGNGLWSPDGMLIAYEELTRITPKDANVQQFRSRSIHAHDVAIGQDWVVTDFGKDWEFDIWEMSWAPDSRHLAFTQWMYWTEDSDFRNLYLVDICEGIPQLLLEDIRGGLSWRVVEE